MEVPAFIPEQKFTAPHEELAFLRERLKELERKIERKEAPPALPTPAHAVIREYGKHEPERVLEKGYRMREQEVDSIVLDLSPEEHDAKMSELLAVLREKGIRNALSVVERLGNPHVEDDFHRFLAEYLKEGYPTPGLKEKELLWKALHMTLLEITLPNYAKRGENDRQKTLKEIISSMEQLYAGALAVSEEKILQNHFSVELAVESKAEHATFFMAVPTSKKELFEKQILSVFPHARVAENKNDYNVFNEEGVSACSVGKFGRPSGYPIKTYDAFDYDPLNLTLSAFAKLAPEGEGAAIQILVKPRGDYYAKRFSKAVEEMKKGVKPGEALNAPETLAGHAAKHIGKMLFRSKDGEKKKEKEEKQRQVNDVHIEQVTKKLDSPVVACNIRLIASAPSETRAAHILGDLESTFNQFEDPRGNKISFERLKGGKQARVFKNFSFRFFEEDKSMPLNLKELTTIFHLPSADVESSRELKRSKAGSASAPVGLPREGILLGVNRYGNVETPIYFGRDDRVRHLYAIGQTGTGKTTLLKNMIVQDIKNGDGVCMIDPHGTDIQDVLAAVPPERYDDVLYFDPSYTARPVALNMLEYNKDYPEQKTFVVNELFSIFQKLYGAVPESMGPMFEQYFRNATMLVIEDPTTGNTLFDVSRVMSDKAYRDLKLSRCGNPIVVQFWRDVAEKAGGEASLANIVPYITSKFDVFLANDIMRPIVVQPKSAFNFREIMDGRKILLVNLAKGRLGDINANLLGLIIVGKILMAALSRVDVLGREEVHDFYLYIDEFQNVTTDSIAVILSEARKYRLGLTIAHQFIAQLEEKTKNAVFGNVGSLASFRVGADDAEYLETQFAPVFSAHDLQNLDNFNAYLKLLVQGRPVRPFDIQGIRPEAGDRARGEELQRRSYERYGRPREEVEADIRARYERRASA